MTAIEQNTYTQQFDTTEITEEINWYFILHCLHHQSQTVGMCGIDF